MQGPSSSVFPQQYVLWRNTVTESNRLTSTWPCSPTSTTSMSVSQQTLRLASSIQLSTGSRSEAGEGAPPADPAPLQLHTHTEAVQ